MIHADMRAGIRRITYARGARRPRGACANYVWRAPQNDGTLALSRGGTVMNIGELCSRDLVSAPAGTSLRKVAQLMKDEHVGIVVITKAPAEEPVAAGVVTDRDLACAMLDRAGDFARMRAEEVMAREPLVLCEDDSVETAIRKLRDRGVRRAPVVSSRGRLVGLISTDDLVAHVAGELAGLARLLEQQPARERFAHRATNEPRFSAFAEAGHGI
jgi:CBS domain-containing protein